MDRCPLMILYWTIVHLSRGRAVMEGSRHWPSASDAGWTLPDADVMEGSRGCPWPSGLPKPFVPGERTERRDATEHRRRILEVARRLFAERGVDAVSMHQIAMAAGIGQGTLYRRYANKGELCMDLLREHHEQFVEEIAALFAAKETSPALERLDGVLAHSVAFLEEQGALLGPSAVTDVRDLQCDESDISRR